MGLRTMRGRKQELAKRVVGVGLKVTVSALLIGFLIHKKVLDVAALQIFVARPAFTLGVLGLWMTTALVLCTTRWCVLLRIADARVSWWRALAMQSTGVFFGAVIPGAVGGDLVKALMVARDEPRQKTPAILLVGVAERLTGLVGLLMLAVFSGLVQWSRVMGAPALRRPFFVALLFAGCAVLGGVVFIFLGRRATLSTTVSDGRWGRVRRFAAKLLESVALFGRDPRRLAVAFALSFVMHGVNMCNFWLVARAVAPLSADITRISLVFPLGILTLVIPVAPAGLGVGHMAFETLFASVGLHDGATIFNVFVVGQLAASLTGGVPYVMMRRKVAAAQAESDRQSLGPSL